MILLTSKFFKNIDLFYYIWSVTMVNVVVITLIVINFFDNYYDYQNKYDWAKKEFLESVIIIFLICFLISLIPFINTILSVVGILYLTALIIVRLGKEWLFKILEYYEYKRNEQK